MLYLQCLWIIYDCYTHNCIYSAPRLINPGITHVSILHHVGHCGNYDSDDSCHICFSRKLLTHSRNVKHNLCKKLCVLVLFYQWQIMVILTSLTSFFRAGWYGQKIIFWYFLDELRYIIYENKWSVRQPTKKMFYTSDSWKHWQKKDFSEVYEWRWCMWCKGTYLIFLFKADTPFCKTSFHYWYPTKKRVLSIFKTHEWGKK